MKEQGAESVHVDLSTGAGLWRTRLPVSEYVMRWDVVLGTDPVTEPHGGQHLRERPHLMVPVSLEGNAHAAAVVVHGVCAFLVLGPSCFERAVAPDQPMVAYIGPSTVEMPPPDAVDVCITVEGEGMQDDVRGLVHRQPLVLERSARACLRKNPATMAPTVRINSPT